MRYSRKKQQGISLYIVIVIVLLSTLLALWSSRTSIFNEMIVGNDADYQRAYEAAQAMLQDAEIDIKSANDRECLLDSKKICRLNLKVKEVITDRAEIEALIAELKDKDGNCLNGLCSKRIGAQDFWKNKILLGKLTGGDVSKNENPGTRYGQYTGATVDKTNGQILMNHKEGEGAWYWIEVMKYGPDEKPAAGLVEGLGTQGLNVRLIYRITAIAKGMKTNTQVVLQSVVALPPITGE